MFNRGTKTFTIIIIQIFLLIFCLKLIEARDRTFLLERFTDCSNGSSVVKFANLSFPFANNFIHILANLSVTEDLSEELQLELSADRCQISRDTCEPFESFTLKDLCARFHSTNIGKYFLNNMRPAVTGCPIKKANYYLEECYINLNLFSYLPIENHRWIIKVEVFDMIDRPNRKLAICIIGQLRVMLTGGRRRIGNRKPKSH